MKSIEEKEIAIRNLMKCDKDYEFAITLMIASCISSNRGGEEQRVLEIGIALKMIEHIRLIDLAKYVALHNDNIDGDTVFNLWYIKTLTNDGL